MVRGAQLLLTAALLGALAGCGESADGIVLADEPAPADARGAAEDDAAEDEQDLEARTQEADAGEEPTGSRSTSVDTGRGGEATQDSEPDDRSRPSVQGDQEPAGGVPAPIEVDHPEAGAALERGPITIAGTSLTYEATVLLELIDPDGAVVETAFTTAEQPAVDERGPFRHTFETRAERPGTWAVRAFEPGASDGEGPPAYSVAVEVTVE